MARKLRPDVVLMDMSMPGMDGAEAARIIRQDVPKAEVIIVTQNDPAVVRQHAEQIGARGYVSKATLARDLLPAILNIIGGPMEGRATPSAKEETPPGKWVFGGGDLGHLIRKRDWSGTPLGPIEHWPQSLKASVNLMLNSQHPIWIGWGPEMTFLYNDAYISVLSLAKHPGSLGRPAREVWAEIWDLCGPLADKVFARGEPSFLNDVRLFMNRGEYLEETYYSFSYNPIYDESGRVAGLFCPSSETTAKNLHARRLRTLSELSAKALVEKSSEAACALSIETIAQNPDDIPFCLLYLLDQDRSVATLKAARGVGKGIDTVSPREIRLQENVAELRWPIREVVWSCQSRLVEVEDLDALPWGPAGQRVVEAMVLPMISPGEGQPIGVLIAGVNPTRKMDSEYRTFYVLIADQVGTAIQNARAVENEKKRADALAEIDRAKTQFFSNVSHEFRTPLTLMLAPIEDMLGKEGGLAEDQRDRLELAHRNSLRLLKLVNTLLDFSRIEAGRIEAVYESTDVSTLTAELASMFQSATERVGLKLIIDCPKVAEPVYVDREMWEKIVFNLLSNAFKFTVAGEIEVSLKEKGRTVELSVRDTGTGIPEEELPHLFERFYRVKGARGRTFEGSGIGLALVQELAKLHGGRVRVKSELNRGSTFTVSVPLGREHLPADRIGAERALESTGVRGAAYVEEALRWLPDSEALTEEIQVPVVAGTPELWPKPNKTRENRARILLADDNADMRVYVQRLLRDQYEVISEGDGQAALERAREQRPDLILSDVMMPRLDGFGLLKAVRADETLRGVPVILLSARAGEDSRIEGLQSGAHDYLIKPFSARELFARVQTQLELARVRKESEEASARRTEAIAESEQKLRLATEAAELGIWNWYPEEDRANWENERMFEIYGRTREDGPINVAGFLEAVIHPQDAPAFTSALQRTLENGERFFFQGRVYRNDGDIAWVEYTGQIELGGNGAATRVVGTTRDITDRKKAEERERQISEEAIAANAKFRAVFEQTTVFAGIMTVDGTLIEANKLCLEACGYRAEEVLGGSFATRRGGDIFASPRRKYEPPRH